MAEAVAGREPLLSIAPGEIRLLDRGGGDITGSILARALEADLYENWTDVDSVYAVNPALVYGRMTGWGQEGPMAQAVGHDLNYLAVSGALSMIGPRGGAPTIPLNLLADLGDHP